MSEHGDGDRTMHLGRSGFIDWQQPPADAYGLDLVLSAVAWLSSWAANLVVFRLGWTVYVLQGESRACLAKHRFPSRGAAVDAWGGLQERYGIQG